MRGNSQNGGQTTKSLLIKPQCSGVPNTAGSVAFLLLSTTLPAFCLRIFPRNAGRRKVGGTALAPGLLHTKPPRLPATETGAVRLLYGYFFQALTQNLARGLLVSPAYAGKDKAEHLVQHHIGITPAYAGKSVVNVVRVEVAVGSPPRMRGKAEFAACFASHNGITPAYAGKRPATRAAG